MGEPSRRTSWASTSTVRSPTRSCSPTVCGVGRSLGVERLDDVVVGTDLESPHDVGRIAAGGEHDDGDTRLRTDPRADLDTVHAREHEVEKHEVGALGAPFLDCPRTVSAEHRLETLSTEHDTDHLGERDVVVDHKNA